MDMTQDPFQAHSESVETGGFGGDSRPDWRALRDRLGAAHALRCALDRPGTAVLRGSFAPLAGWRAGVFTHSGEASGEQGKEPVNPKALSNGKGGRAIADGTAGSLMAGG
jgi:hypothetical protein